MHCAQAVTLSGKLNRITHILCLSRKLASIIIPGSSMTEIAETRHRPVRMKISLATLVYQSWLFPRRFVIPRMSGRNSKGRFAKDVSNWVST